MDMVNENETKMRILLVVFITVSLIGCHQKINCNISGYVFTKEKPRIDSIEIGQMARHSPINYTEIKFNSIKINKNGFFKYNLKKRKSNSDKKFNIYFTSNRYNKVVKTTNIYDNKSINLDTTYFKKK